MKLDRNKIVNNGRGKYALLKLRELALYEPQETFAPPTEIENAVKTLEDAGILDWGEQGTESEFFVVRLKDRNARAALEAYAKECSKTDLQFAHEVNELASRAGPNSEWCKEPD